MVDSDFTKKAKKRKLRIYDGSDKRLIVVKVPFGIPQIDTVLGGGIPLGRTIVVTGNFGAGKTFFSQMTMANFQKLGYSVAYVDTERRYDPPWFASSGVNIDTLKVAQPSSGENALDTCAFLVEEKFGLVVLDSIAALVPTAELEGSMEDSTIASQARLLNKGLRKITELNIASEDLTYKGTAFVLLNQMRSGIGPFTTYALPGGKGQQFFASILLRIMRGSYIEEDGKKVGFNMKFVTDKNNITTWPQECSLPFRFSGTIDTVGGLVELAIDVGVIIQKGPYFYLPLSEEKAIMGKQALIERLKEDKTLFKTIQEKVYAAN